MPALIRLRIVWTLGLLLSAPSQSGCVAGVSQETRRAWELAPAGEAPILDGIRLRTRGDAPLRERLDRKLRSLGADVEVAQRSGLPETGASRTSDKRIEVMVERRSRVGAGFWVQVAISGVTFSIVPTFPQADDEVEYTVSPPGGAQMVWGYPYDTQWILWFPLVVDVPAAVFAFWNGPSAEGAPYWGKFFDDVLDRFIHDAAPTLREASQPPLATEAGERAGRATL